MASCILKPLSITSHLPGSELNLVFPVFTRQYNTSSSSVTPMDVFNSTPFHDDDFTDLTRNDFPQVGLEWKEMEEVSSKGFVA